MLYILNRIIILINNLRGANMENLGEVNLGELIQTAYNNGELLVTAEGDIYYRGQLVVDLNLDDVQESDWGFIGTPNQYHGRRHRGAEQWIKNKLAEGDAKTAQVIALCPRFFVFVDDQEQFDAMGEGTEELFRYNSSKWFTFSSKNFSLYQLYDLNNRAIYNHFFIALANYDFPNFPEDYKDKFARAKSRPDYLSKFLNIEKWLDFWFVEKYDELFGGG